MGNLVGNLVGGGEGLPGRSAAGGGGGGSLLLSHGLGLDGGGLLLLFQGLGFAFALLSALQLTPAKQLCVTSEHSRRDPPGQGSQTRLALEAETPHCAR